MILLSSPGNLRERSDYRSKYEIEQPRSDRWTSSGAGLEKLLKLERPLAERFYALYARR
jgi:hypothetical protein